MPSDTFRRFAVLFYLKAIRTSTTTSIIMLLYIHHFSGEVLHHAAARLCCVCDFLTPPACAVCVTSSQKKNLQSKTKNMYLWQHAIKISHMASPYLSYRSTSLTGFVGCFQVHKVLDHHAHIGQQAHHRIGVDRHAQREDRHDPCRELAQAIRVSGATHVDLLIPRRACGIPGTYSSNRSSSSRSGSSGFRFCDCCVARWVGSEREVHTFTDVMFV